MFYMLVYFLILLIVSYWAKNQIWVYGYMVVSGVLMLFNLFSSGMSGHSGVYYPLGVDLISLFMLHLTVLVMVVCMLTTYSTVKKDVKLYLLMNYLITLVLVLFFSVWNLLLFFVLFEVILVPMLVMISSFSSQSERVVAVYYMVMYTVISSFPLLLFGVYFMYSYFSLYYSSFAGFQSDILSWSVSLLVIMGFCCKLPIYGLHSWLPKAHVEASVGGSMILAGLLLKMSSYSLLRYFSLVELNSSYLFYFFLLLIMVSMALPVILCSRMVDLKSFIAFSSISHMCIALVGIVVYSMYGGFSAMCLFVGHSVVSPMMFYLANILYEKTYSRGLVGLKGMDSLSSIFMWCILFVIIVNMGIPPFINFFSEISCYVAILNFGFYLVLFLFLTMVLTGAIMFYFVSKLMKGQFMSYNLSEFNLREYYLGVLLFILVLVYTLLIVFVG